MRKYNITVLAGLFASICGASYLIVQATSPITPSTGTPGFVQTAEAHQTTTGTLSVSFGSLPTINNVVIVAGSFNGGSTVNSLDGKVSDNQGNSYARLSLQSPDGQAGVGVSFWCAVVTISSGTYTISLDSNSGTPKGAQIFEYGSTSCNPDKISGGTHSTSPYSCGTVTTKNAKDLLLTVLGINSGGSGTITFTAPTGFTIRNSFGVIASGNPLAVADEVVSAVGTYTPTFTASQNIASSMCGFVALISH